MFENPRRDMQARHFTTNVRKILHLKSSSEQIFSENYRWVPLNNKIQGVITFVTTWVMFWKISVQDPANWLDSFCFCGQWHWFSQRGLFFFKEEKTTFVQIWLKSDLPLPDRLQFSAFSTFWWGSNSSTTRSSSSPGCSGSSDSPGCSGSSGSSGSSGGSGSFGLLDCSHLSSCSKENAKFKSGENNDY